MRYFFIFFLFLIFLFLGSYLFFFSQGYRFSLSKKNFYQTAGIYLKTWPKDSEVFLNGKFQKKTDPIFGSLFLQKLEPKEHSLEVKKTGFFSWKKKVKLKEKKVEEFRNIFLFPEKIKLDFQQDNVLDIWPSREGEVLIQKREKEESRLYLLNQKEKKEIFLPFFKKMSKEAKIKDFFFLPLENKFFLKMEEGKKERYFTFEVGKDNFWQERKKEELTGKEEKKESVNGNSFFLWKNNLFKEDTQGKREKIMEGVNDFLISPRKDKIAIFQDNEIWLLLKENDFERVFLARFSQKIKNPFWLNNHYLLFSLEDKIIISETDTRNGLNYYEWPFPRPKILFNFSEKNFFLLTEGKLFLSEKIF
ncbi:MAG: hypothetical protein ACPLZH_00440 [Minisyncoccales bacterium]